MSDKPATADRYAYGDNRPGNASVAYVAETQLRDIQKTLPLRVLSPDDWKPVQRLHSLGRRHHA